jgi:MOSC domain-containing protein YiiM
MVGELATLVSIQVGRPQPLGHTFSAFRKHPIAGPVFLLPTRLDGDEQAEKVIHGGPEQAVLCYAAGHYPRWLDELGIDFGPGGFGENFTIAGLDEESVCIGDVYEVGDAVVRVTKPRAPCFKIGLRWNMPRLVKLVEQTGRHGWYLGVVEQGIVEAGDEIQLVERPRPDLSVRRAADLRRNRRERG